MSATSKLRKGIILAGGSGTRLYPVTKSVSKQLLPIYDKPMIYYPLSVLMLAGIKEVLIITTPHDQEAFKNLLGDGSQFGISLEYSIQEHPNGLAEAFILGEQFLDGAPVCLILGDNLYYGHGLTKTLQQANDGGSTASVFALHVQDPERYGIVEMDKDNKALSIEEKPENPKSSWAVTGLYFFDERAPAIAKQVKPSARGEIEITEVIDFYLKEASLKVNTMSRGMAWFDTGTHDSMVEAIEFVRAIENRTGQKIACLEEIAWVNGWIDDAKLAEHAETYKKSRYGQYLMSLLSGFKS
ncbi:glucose-1-phosphate thymidylyltransferase RfbA [Rubritalea marina]|uniref:glucose-1-phosphate thymidylyltransferase RfbA n=1 Tax=Rubritalea marina TaxID=361055 RepID=UPI000475640A|nr:glucose-1-phosphate thymidylyltransferase RfbA [Rubritalea marina]